MENTKTISSRTNFLKKNKTVELNLIKKKTPYVFLKGNHSKSSHGILACVACQGT